MFKVGSVVSSPINAQYFVPEALTSYAGFGSENQGIADKDLCFIFPCSCNVKFNYT